MKTPPLKPGDMIGVMAPSSFVERADIEKSKAFLEARGYRVFIHPQTYARHHQSAGTTEDKARAFHELWERKDIQALWAAGGGNRALHLLGQLDFKRLKRAPRPLVGFSDVTVLLNGLCARTGIKTVHGPVFKNIHKHEKHEQIDHLLALLAGETPDYPFENATILHEGYGEGPLIGGNLSIFQYLPALLPKNFCAGAILFLEDCHEELSHIDRMLLHLKNLGVFNQIHGLVFGEFSDWKDTGRPYGFTFEEIIAEHIEGVNVPVITNAPFGHGRTFYALPVGGKAALSVTSGRVQFKLLKPAFF